MKDFHSHILFDVDDGAYNIEHSIKIIKKALKNNYTDIVLTPHFRYKQNYTANNLEKQEKFKKLKAELKKQNIDINIYLGNEITIDEDLFYYLNTNQIATINNSKYLLIELPLDKKYKNLEKDLIKLLSLNYIPIIAHPERYNYIKKIKYFKKLSKKGVLFQGNIGSLYNYYGKKAKKKLKKLLKKNLIHFLGSDIHSDEDEIYTKTQDLMKKLKKYLKKDKKIKKLLITNFEKVINNEDL